MRVGIIGATGYTGFELIKILARHSSAKISAVTSDSSAGSKISNIYPYLTKICDLTLESNNYNNISDKVDAVFLCLPHGASQDAASFFYKKGKLVIDLSADFRIKDQAVYEKTYNTPHNAADILEQSVYGIPEIFYNEIKQARLIANPGCYPTSVIVPLFPLLKERVVDNNFIVADSKSGVSGAGKNPSAKTHFCEVNEDFKPYGIFSHRHNPEIDFILSKALNNTHITFTPHLLPVNRGIESTIYLKKTSNIKLKTILEDYYKNSIFVRVRKDDSIPTIKDVSGTNFVDINIFEEGNIVIIVSCIDNLIKGASGQAVQNMNIAAGFDEKDGLL
ncbi:N-acetyl-gamma-glutamyl-phosphate reductase [Deferribacterales bacterium Es71-Z0220]|uniref:N-acetyl-gamma-glutamyl-phosphate reductase n=1 Tax=Deferrivibrio essentukiensis TaxID=2880922 RepID=UPI001F6025BA|nr:N-acetyl-gamma-glutamyl-phosphate reductase [Deferrivibrio essentukiensis]MCB4203671.1 N-acetyl-gamma-glutamyl-phosphate reductase [Deferrivibrio essentukiensis]